MRKHHLLHGLTFRPSATNQEDYEKYIFSADYSVKGSFKKSYQDHMAAMQIIGLSAKIYALNNWKRVKDWRSLEISIIDNSGKEAYYYNHQKKTSKSIRSKAWARSVERIERWKKKFHNPVKKISDMVLDTIDGDFSVKINGKWHGWIDDQSVIVLADYIEKKVK